MSLSIYSFTRIQLYHNYNLYMSFSTDDINKSLKPLYDESVTGTKPEYAIMLSLFVQNIGVNGVSEQFILDKAYQINPYFTELDYINAFQQLLKQGIIARITPQNVNCNYGCPPTPLFTFHPQMDRMPNNKPFVEYMLYLVGGYTSPDFYKYFILPTNNLIATGNKACIGRMVF